MHSKRFLEPASLPDRLRSGSGLPGVAPAAFQRWALLLALPFLLALIPGERLAAANTNEIAIPIPGWRIELVAQAPEIRHPSVVACAPDGRVFVAEDPMDISRPAQVAEGRNG